MPEKISGLFFRAVFPYMYAYIYFFKMLYYHQTEAKLVFSVDLLLPCLLHAVTVFCLLVQTKNYLV